MRFTIRLECEGSDESVVVGTIDRQGPLRGGTFGMTLVESKQILAGLQQAVTQRQFGAYLSAQRTCPMCGIRRQIKDYHSARLQSLFGEVPLRIPRLRHCACASNSTSTTTISIEGLADWVSPELHYVQAELAATIPYARTHALLQLLLPVGRGNSTSTVRRRIQMTAIQRLQRRMQDLGSPGETVTVFSDGDARLRSLLPGAAHVLDWFHLTRYLTVINEILFGREAIEQFPAVIHDRLCEWLVSMKWRLWHGRVEGALQRMQSMRFIVQRNAVRRKPATVRLRRQLDTLHSYLTNNADSIPNYAQRYRRGERISTAFVESAVNQLIDKRMSKSQQMRWSPQGAHAVLQVRAEVIDQRLRADFARWHPGFLALQDSMPIAA